MPGEVFPCSLCLCAAMSSQAAGAGARLDRAAAGSQGAKGKRDRAERPGKGNWMYLLRSSVWRESNMAEPDWTNEVMFTRVQV